MQPGSLRPLGGECGHLFLPTLVSIVAPKDWRWIWQMMLQLYTPISLLDDGQCGTVLLVRCLAKLSAQTNLWRAIAIGVAPLCEAQGLPVLPSRPPWIRGSTHARHGDDDGSISEQQGSQ